MRFAGLTASYGVVYAGWWRHVAWGERVHLRSAGLRCYIDGLGALWPGSSMPCAGACCCTAPRSCAMR